MKRSGPYRIYSATMHYGVVALVRLRPFAFGLALCFTSICLHGQSRQPVADTARTDKVHIDGAEVVRSKIIDGHEQTYLIGNVELSQDSVYFYCDSAMIVDKREVSAFGNIIIQKGDSLQVFADTLFYLADTRLADLFGEVALLHGTQQLWTTHLAYDMAENIARYDRPAQLLDSTTQLSSKRGIYWVDTEEALFIDSVVVIDPQFTLFSDSMRYNAPTQTARFIAPTQIFQDGGEIYCESGYYDLANRNAEFAVNARYEKEDQHAEADVIRYDGALNEIELTGNARYVDGDTQATGDTITYNDDTGDTRITGNAEFRDSKSQARSEIITYNKHTEKVGLQGRGQISQGSQTIRAESIDQDQKTGRGLFTGAVVISDTSAQTILESDIVETIEENGFIKAFGERRPLLKSIVDADTLYVTADTLISFEIVDTAAADTLRYLHGYADVRIFRGTMQGLCDSLDFNSRDSVFRMLGDPILWSDTTQFTADTIDLYLRDKALDQIVLRTKAFITSSILGQFYDQISGKRIIADMDSSALRSMHVIGNAESIYYVRDDNQAFVGVNQVVSSEIFFVFQKGELDQIKFTTHPTGKMTPMALADHSAVRLDAFVWRNAERPITLDDLY